MNAAFVVYDGLTALDFIGAYDPITRLGTMGYLDLEWDVCSPGRSATASGGLTIEADRIEPNLGDYDLLFVPGGFAARELRADDAFVEWLQTGADCTYKTSVCTGSLLLGAAGFLEGRRATTHPSAYELLAEYCDVIEDRVVFDGDAITGRGVSSSLDLGLSVVEKLTDAETRAEIAEQMDYPYGEWVEP